MAENDHPVFKDIGAIASAALEFTDVAKMEEFVRAQNSKLSMPFTDNELQVIIEAAAKDIRKKFSKFDAGVCLVELQSITPSEDQKDRFTQAKDYMEKLIEMEGSRADIQLFIETDVFDHFRIRLGDPFGKNLCRHMSEKFSDKKKAQKSATTLPTDSEEDAFQFPADIMDKNTGRSRVYHTLANEYISKNIVKCESGRLRRYTNGIYPESNENVDFIRTEIIRYGELHGVLLTDDDAKRVVKIIENKTRVSQEECEPDNDYVVVLNNGLLDTRDWQFREFSPEKIYFSKIPIDYLPDAPKPENFMRFIDSCFEGNEAQKDLLQEAFGYCLMKNYKYQDIFYLLGDGGNGKGSAVAILRMMLGEENVTSFSLFQLTDGEHIDYNIAMMEGKHANICGDVGTARVKNTENLKKLSSGTDSVTGRHVREKPFQFINYAKMFFLMNRAPTTDAHTTGDKRRTRVINFINSFSEKKGEIKDIHKVIAEAGELPGVLLWAIEGLKRLEANKGFSDTRTITQRALEYEKKSQTVRYFVEECLYEDPGCIIPNAIMYQSYESFRKRVGGAELGERELKASLLRECKEAGWMNVTNKQVRVTLLPEPMRSTYLEFFTSKQPRCFYGINIVQEEPQKEIVEFSEPTVSLAENDSEMYEMMREDFENDEANSLS